MELGAGEVVVMHSPQAIVHYPAPPNTSQAHFEEHHNRPKAVRREFPDLDHITVGKQPGSHNYLTHLPSHVTISLSSFLRYSNGTVTLIQQSAKSSWPHPLYCMLKSAHKDYITINYAKFSFSCRPW